jgi:hypothetical protein
MGENRARNDHAHWFLTNLPLFQSAYTLGEASTIEANGTKKFKLEQLISEELDSSGELDSESHR